MDPNEKDFIVIVQCHLVQQRCSGILCEQAFHNRTDGFADYPVDRHYRTVQITCGGCCGRALNRKLIHLLKHLKAEGVERDRVVVHLSSCIAFDNFHGPPCPNREVLHTIMDRLSLDWREGTRISQTAERRRAAGVYRPRIHNERFDDRLPPTV